MLITLVAGARPNFVKIKPIIDAILNYRQKGFALEYRLIHTGQHYDAKMSHSFFQELNIPHPDLVLNLQGKTSTEQITEIMIGFEQELIDHKPDLVIVVGDVNSTMATAIVTKKCSIPLAHIEAGIRSFDNTMPEEINRKITDSISDLFFTTTPRASQQLRTEGVDSSKIHFVGNVMIDTLLVNLSHLREPACFVKHNIQKQNYFVLTLHRPSNVDDEENLLEILKVIEENSGGYPVLFPIHPRTRSKLNTSVQFNSILFLDPMSYLEFNYMVKHAKGVITDSGGITEETTVMNVPCITLRDSTERPETCEIGTNLLVGKDPKALLDPIQQIITNKWKKGGVPEKWDGKSAKRIIKIITDQYLK